MELTEEQLNELGCKEDQDTCPCWPCKARRDLKEARRLMQVAVNGYRSGIIFGSDRSGYINAIADMQTFLGTPSNGEGRQ